MLYGDLPTITVDGAELRGVRVRVPNPPKSAILRLPTNEEMVARLQQQKSIRRSLGRRKSKTEFVPNREADLRLFDKIRLDQGAEFDEFEASNAIAKLMFCEVTDCERVGEQYKVTLQTPFGPTAHTLKIPTVREISVYRRTVMASIDLPHGQEELRYQIYPAIELYDAVASGIDGYSVSLKPADVPPHHKSTVIVELVQAVDEDIDPDLDPNS